MPLTPSFYVIHLREWLKTFPRKQFHIFRTEDYARNMSGILTDIFSFLNVCKYIQHKVFATARGKSLVTLFGEKNKTKTLDLIIEYWQDVLCQSEIKNKSYNIYKHLCNNITIPILFDRILTNENYSYAHSGTITLHHLSYHINNR